MKKDNIMDVQIEYIREKADNREIYIWGAWDFGCLIEKWLLEKGNIQIKGYLDSDPCKENSTYNNKIVKTPSIVNREKVFLLISLVEHVSVRRILEGKGYMEYRDYLYCGKTTSISCCYNYQDILGNKIQGDARDILINMTFKNKLVIGKNVTFGKNVKINLIGFSEIIIGDNVHIQDDAVISSKNAAKIVIGKNVSIGHNAKIVCRDDHSKIIIGMNSTFTDYLSLRVLNHSQFECGKDCMFAH